jgi:hypothetical protein
MISGVLYDDRSMYLFSTWVFLWGLNSWGVYYRINPMGDFFFFRKFFFFLVCRRNDPLDVLDVHLGLDIFKMVCCHGNHESLKKKKNWSDYDETSQEWFLRCADAHSCMKIFKMIAIPVNVQKIFFLSDCNETSQEWSLGCVEVHSGFEIFRIAIVTMVTMKVHKFCFGRLCSLKTTWILHEL